MYSSCISSVVAYEIIDSRGNPTIEVSLTIATNYRGIASVPSGASTGSYEATELRDGGERYNGKGVLKACNNVINLITPAIVGQSFTQESLDALLKELDGTDNFSFLGANAVLGVSLAFCRAQAEEKRVPLFEHISHQWNNDKKVIPLIAFNVINGGKHADSGLTFQEFMIVPTGYDTITKGVEATHRVLNELSKSLQEQGLSIGLGDEGGYAPHLASNEEAIEVIKTVLKKAGEEEKFRISLDVAGSELYNSDTQRYTIDKNESKSSDEMVAYYNRLIDQYHLFSLEDPFHEDDWQGFQQLTRTSGSSCFIVGDDLTVTNQRLIDRAIESRALTTVLIKPNQIGTVTDTLHAVYRCHSHGLTTFMSHRSGETSDTSIADIAVGMGCSFIKAGSLRRGERVAKYNRLMEIERMIML